MNELVITSPSFSDEDYMPKKHTGFGSDVSPEFHLQNLSDKTVSVAIIMDDLDIPFVKEFNHWIIWNIPKMEFIPEDIPHGSPVSTLGDAVQGVAYGLNGYRGPKQPVFVRNTHRYIFKFYVLDCFLKLSLDVKKKYLVRAMQGHVIQSGSITGRYKR